MAINKKTKVIATNMYLYIYTYKDVTKIKLKSMNISTCDLAVVLNKFYGPNNLPPYGPSKHQNH